SCCDLPRVELFFRTIPRHDLTSHRTNTAGPPLLSRTPHSWQGLASKHLRAPERPRWPRESAMKSNYVGQAFQPDSEPCQAGKPDLLPCPTNNFPVTRRR